MNKQEAIERLKRMLFNNDSQQACEAINMAISALTQQLNNRWIPVSSGRLPEDRDYPPVNCCNIEDKWSDSAIVNEHGQFINSDECQIYPTHWKPLPSWEEASDAERD